MNKLSYVRTSLTEVTSREVAQRRATERLNDNPHDLIREIELGISRQVGQMHVSARGGNYTPEVVAHVAELYRGMGWHVDVGGYWMTLT